MATINLGRIKSIWRGTWATGTAYVKDDIVQQGVSSYICVTAHTAGATFAGDSAKWELMAKGLAANNLADKAWFTFLDSGNLRDIFAASGAGGGDRAVMPFSNVLDPFDIIGTTGSNQFQVNATGYYDVDAGHTGHANGHYHPPYVYNNTDSAFAPRPNGSFSGSESWMTATPSYASAQDPRSNTASEPYYLVAGKNYSFRISTEQTGGLGSTTNYLNGGYTVGGIQKYNAPFKAAITKLSGV